MDGEQPKKKHKVIRVVAIIVVVLVLLGLGIHLYNVRIAKLYDDLATNEAKAYTDPVRVKKLILDGVTAILDNPVSAMQAKKYASDFGIDYTQAVVDMSIAQLKTIGLLTD